MTWFNNLSPAMKYTLGAIVAVLFVALAFGLELITGPGPMSFAGGTRVALADYHGANPTGVPAELANAGVVARGEYLARAADCAACHTAKGGAPYAGGLAINLPFGTIYSPNITPDKDTGIGNWTDAEFLNAVHRGIDDEGHRLYPAMPYASYTYMTDADALAIKAYLFSLAPVHAPNKESALSFPFNQRWLMAFWDMFFNPDERFAPNTARSAEWNRGAYLSEAMAHCGECHTPRNLAFALDNRSKFGGAVTAGWRAYNISSDKGTGVGAWSDGALADYLAHGHAMDHGTASGPMGEAVNDSFRYLVPSDIKAIVAYLRTVPAIRSKEPATLAGPAPATHREPPGLDERGKMLFAGNCMSCHGWTGKSPIWNAATLTGVRAVNDPSAVNVAQVVIEGARHQLPDGTTVFMPAFGASFSDEEVAAVANYVTGRFGSAKSSLTAKDVASLRRQASR
ncbi:MAG TPA: cytochrome c [Rhizomicrobium sp.]|nr:cytochrome c [Rhizomicrobium sp.]